MIGWRFTSLLCTICFAAAGGFVMATLAWPTGWGTIRHLRTPPRLFLGPTEVRRYYPIPILVATAEALRRFTQKSTLERSTELCFYPTEQA